MSILKLLAIITCLVAIIVFIAQNIKKTQRSTLLFSSVVLLSLTLFFVTHQAEARLDKTKTASGIGQTDTDKPVVQDTFAKDSLVKEDPKSVDEQEQALAVVVDDNPIEPKNTDTEGIADEPVIDKPAIDVAPEIIANADPVDLKAPVADAGSSIEAVKVNDAVSFSAKASKKGENGRSISTYAWDFGDGQKATGRDVKHAYETAGSFTATLTVTDAAGLSATATRLVGVTRPENKMRYVNQRLDDFNGTGSANVISGTFDKQFEESKTHLEVIAYIASKNDCTCTLTARITGPQCAVHQSKALDNGGEGETSVRAVCKGAMGTYTWSVSREASSTSCECVWTKVRIDGFES